MSDEFSKDKKMSESDRQMCNSALSIGFSGMTTALFAANVDANPIVGLISTMIKVSNEFDESRKKARIYLNYVKESMSDSERTDFLSRWIGRFVIKALYGDADELDVAKYYEYRDELMRLYKNGLFK